MKQYIMAIRPALLVLGFLGPIALLAWVGELGSVKSIFIILAVGFYNAGTNIANEWYDRYDDMNKRRPPILDCDSEKILGLMTLSYSISIVSIIYLASIDIGYFLIGMVGAIGGFIYNHERVKDVRGNLVLGVSYGTAALMATYPSEYLFPILFGVYAIAHNIGVQVQDFERKADSIPTFPSEVGTRKSIYVSLFAATVATIGFAYIGLPIFALATMFVFMGGALNLFMQNSEFIYELFHRYIARILLLVGFIWMLVSGIGLV